MRLVLKTCIFLKVIPEIAKSPFSLPPPDSDSEMMKERERESAIVTVPVSDQLPYLNSKPHFHPMILVGETAKLPSFAYPKTPFPLPSLCWALLNGAPPRIESLPRLLALKVAFPNGWTRVGGLRTWDLGLSSLGGLHGFLNDDEGHSEVGMAHHWSLETSRNIGLVRIYSFWVWYWREFDIWG